MDKQQSSPNLQDSPHKEGTQNNTAPKDQPRGRENSESVSTRNQDSNEQRGSRENQNQQGEEA